MRVEVRLVRKLFAGMQGKYDSGLDYSVDSGEERRGWIWDRFLEVELKRLVELAVGSERKERSSIIKFLSGAIRYLEVPCSKMGKIGRLLSFVGSIRVFFLFC